MGVLQNGKWVDQWYETQSSEGRFKRKAPQFRNWITADGSARPTGDSGFKAEAGRHHLYVSFACSWAHRTLIFRALKGLKQRLSKHRYLAGTTITEADWRLFTTLVRFDPVYVGHFKSNIRRIADYPNLSGSIRDLYQQPGVAATVNMAHIKNHYYGSHKTVNPSCVVPVGPQIYLAAPHDRARLA